MESKLNSQITCRYILWFSLDGLDGKRQLCPSCCVEGPTMLPAIAISFSAVTGHHADAAELLWLF